MSTFDNQLSARPDSHESRQTGIDDRTPALRRTAYGMIDYDFYLRRSQRLRGEATNRFFRAVGNALLGALQGRAPGKDKARSALQVHRGTGFARPTQSHI